MQPFFTTKPTGTGTGMGLSITYDMVVKGACRKFKCTQRTAEYRILNNFTNMLMKRTIVLCIFLILCHSIRGQQRKIDSLLSKLDRARTQNDIYPILTELKPIPGGFLAAINKYKADLAGFESSGDQKSQERILLALCTIMNWEVNTPDQLRYALQGLRLSRRAKDNYYIDNFLMESAVAYDEQRDLHKAAGYYRACAIAATAAHDTDLTLTSYSNLQTIYSRTFKMPDSALYFAKCETQMSLHLDTGKYWYNISNNLSDYGEAFASANKLDSALSYYRRSYILTTRHDPQNLNPEVLNDIAELYLKMQKPDSAIKYALKGYSQSQTAEALSFYYNAEAAGILSRAYEGRDDKKSLSYLRRQLLDKDSIEARGQSKQLQLVADQDKEHEQDLLVAQDSFDARMRFYVVIGTAAVLLVVGLALWRGYNHQKQNNRLLSEQKEEIATQRDHLETAIDKLRATQTQLIQSEKMASLGELTAGIAHEIQNPLNFVNNFSEVNKEMLEELKAESEKPRAERDVQLEIELINDLIENESKINHHGKRADAIVKGMLQHSQSGSRTKEPTNLNRLSDEYLRLSYQGLRSKYKAFKAEMVTHFDEKLPLVNVIPQDVGRVMFNLFNNAFYAVNQKATKAGAEYKPEVSLSTSSENGQVVIKVRDNGIGIPDAIKDKIMQPFFTTKPTGEGTGLGLSLTYDIVVKGYGGTINVQSKESEGSEFVIMLPVER